MGPFLHKKKRPRCRDRFFVKCLWLVPAAATAISAVTAATIATVSTATTTATAATISAAATATAAFALFHRTRLVDRQGAAVDFLAMEFRDGRLRFFRRAHFHETKAAGDDPSRDH